MRRFSTTLAIAISTLLFVSICSAQQTATTSVPNLIRYSGTLKDAQGAALPSSTAVGVSFSIYKQQDGGASVWMETQNVTPDSNGQYNVILGSTTATGLPDDLFSQQEQRWLGVQVQGEAEQARVLLVSVPYAFKAHEAETLGGLPASAFVQVAPSNASGSGSTDTGIAAGTAVNALSAAGKAGSASNRKGASVSPKDTVCSTLTAIGRANYIPLFGSPTVCNLVNSAIFQLATSFPPPGGPTFFMGINQPQPTAELDVNGAINASPYSANPNSGNYQIGEHPILSIGWPNNESIFGNQNTLVGGYAGAQGFQQGPGTGNTGTSETFVGYNAGFHNQAGSNNTALGEFAGYRNVNGNGNTSVGAAAGFGVFGVNVSNTTITGFNAGYNNTASNVSFYGYQAGLNNTGVQNTFLGYSAGMANTAGFSNVFVGFNAGLTSTDPGGANSYNTFVGTNSGASSNQGANTFLGYAAGSNTAGLSGRAYGNTATGYDAGRSNTTGFDNAIYGYNAGYNIVNPTTGSQNTYLGAGAGSSISGAFGNGNNNIFVGFAAGNAENNVNSNIEIGNTGPAPTSPPAPTGNNTILIGTQGTGAGQQSAVFITPVLSNPTNSTPDVVTIATSGPTAGLLGHSPFPTGSGGNNVCAKKNYQIDSSCDVVLSIDSNASAFDGNLFVGVGAGVNNIPGGQQGNTFIGYNSGNLYKQAGGDANTFLGFQAGYCIGSGNYDIDIGYGVGPGCSPPNGVLESNTIRIGSQGVQNMTFIAGIYGTTIGPTNSEVCVDNTGKLGTANCPSNLSSRLIAAQQGVIKTQQQQIQTQGQQIADLQERLSRLESLIGKK
jgi:hypothetical protein